MKKFLLVLLMLLPLGASAQQVITATQSAPIAISSATTTLIVTGVTGKQILVTAIDILSSATGTVLVISGTGSTCGSSTVSITGTYALIAGSFLQKGDGLGVLWPIATGSSVCITTTGAGNFNGSITYALFP